MKYIVTEESSNKNICQYNNISDIVNHFKQNYKYKIPNFLKEYLKTGTSIKFSLNDKNYIVSIKDK